MTQSDSPVAKTPAEDVYLAPRFGLIEFIRRLREDRLSVIAPESYRRNLIRNRIFFLDSFVVNKPEYIEHVLLSNHRNYVKSQLARTLLGPLLGNGLLLSEGAFWRRQRAIAAPAFQPKRVGGFVDVMAAEAQAMAEDWSGRREPFDVAAEMMALTLTIIARTMFSTAIAGEIETVRQLMDQVVAQPPNLLDLFGLPRWLPRSQPKNYRAAVRAFDALVSRIIAERRAQGVDHGDLLSMLLSARDPESGEGMSDKQLRDEILTFFVAGHETTANALSWTWHLLAQYPDVEAKLRAELARVLGGRAPNFADLAELQYTRMVIEEAMRLYPPAHTISRTALREDWIGGVRIPAGAVIFINVYVTHRNPNLWPEPERFDPERFAPEAVAKRHRFAYLPFGGGPRVCIGNGFAMAEAQTILATLAQRCRLRPAPDHEVKPIGLVTLRPKDGVWMKIA
ncbi:cytochrome P450 [Methylocapsa acidiphila]|uniref:cytochrome P450 n=1 Tax=Methylocapsa acidiphila TaxID=133552 RepID=UPI0004102BEC|nr:cytochrome P450 [Methylocapsa acidiphila]